MRLETTIDVFDHQRPTGAKVRVYSKGGKPGTFRVCLEGPSPLGTMSAEGIKGAREALAVAESFASLPVRRSR